VFDDDERHRAFVSDLVLGQGTSNRLGDKYREDSILIEPDAGHFDLERPDIVSKHLESLLGALDEQQAVTSQAK
jgi:hypothetical protein